MRETIEYIKRRAKEFHACETIDGLETIEQLFELFYSPQGLEFAEKAHFPTIDVWNALAKVCDIKAHGVFLCESAENYPGGEFTTLVGKTRSSLKFDKNNVCHVVVLMHGAEANIEASGYAVVKVVNCGGTANIISKENAVILR